MSVAGFHIAASIPFTIPKYLHNYRMQDCYNGKKSTYFFLFFGM